MSHSIVSLSEATFDNTINESTKPVLVDFWAEWCGPCKMVAPILEEIAQEYGDKIIIAKLNVEQNPNIAPKFGIRGIPTLLIFKNGEVVATQVGALSKAQLKAFIDPQL
ncbi:MULTISPECIES: thioredoxin TrxA [unclassified Gilliamella]|uniref:thioredoxin TrxA n=1 Tax=unclassified Gilliamella TaxID=2685620 RepID=UPI000B1BDC0E|nr:MULTISPECIES: thioredoxin TrxA [unclassified Gilliamella]MBI0006219.1 thioredoxin TrxA [Gilliamella sp. W8126]MBI0037451.1 thioredoxin TrxA [Gilliamella sp. B14384G10]MBI0040618.1 thioredoxin TrxA [Gilliamella sp. B14384G7]MBI0052457.1 thioredoxin TrxA [Gilliamella sp. B14384G13]MBI0053738.1 thioredoxin TrxA [Gilliamella sp. B14384H2]